MSHQSLSIPSVAFPSVMRRVDAARYLRDNYGIPCVATTLAKYACTGEGPKFRRVGKFPIYARADLDVWANQPLGKLVRCTAELIDQRA